MEQMVIDPKQLQRYRLLARRSRAAMAKEVGCSLESYYAWETGEHWPNEYWLGRIAKAAGCRPEDLAEKWTVADDE